MTTVNPEASRQAVVEAALVLLERMRLTLADLAAVPPPRKAVPTFAEYVPVVSPGHPGVLRRRARGGSPMHVMAAADELIRQLGAEADPLGEHSPLMVLARTGALALMDPIELNGSGQAQPSR